MYCEQRDHVTKLIHKAKSAYFTTKCEECGNDQKALFRFLNQLLHKNDTCPLPDYTSLIDLLQSFSDFFLSKIENIRKSLDSVKFEDIIPPSSFLPITDPKPPSTLKMFRELSDEDVKKIIMKSPTKSCPLDPIPTSLLKDLVDILIPPIKRIINLSLKNGMVPTSMKKALVTPILKKSGSDKNILKNYRPVSNLSFLSKLIEKAVLSQINEHMIQNSLHTPVQSAYRSGHSTETALLAVQNDILCHLDSGRGVILVLLDLSAAFDTIDHNILMSRLESRIGITGDALKWFKSYLQDRYQCITISGELSKQVQLKYGVPQGSVSGPSDFTSYSGPVFDLASRHGVPVNLYADDTQLYLPFDLSSPESLNAALEKMENCIGDIRAWMLQNKLQLNSDKTEFLIITPPRHALKFNMPNLKIGSCKIEPVAHARNLGVIFDNSLKLEKHVSSLVSRTNVHLRNIGRIRHLLSDDAVSKLVHALITSRLDNCNSLLFGLSDTLISKLQRVLNTAARVVTRTKPSSHITPVLRELHWLPIKMRIAFKILVLTYKCLQGEGPIYLQNLILPYSPTRKLRSSDMKLLTVPKTQYKSLGDRSFQYAAAHLWNSLPQPIRESESLASFKTHLKTHLFNQSFKS